MPYPFGFGALPSGAFNKRPIQSETRRTAPYTLPCGAFIIDNTAWNKFHISVELYLTLSPAEFSIGDKHSLKYIPYHCGTQL